MTSDSDGDRVDDAADIPDDDLRDYYEQAADVWATMSTFEDFESLIVPGTSSSGARAWYNYEDSVELPTLPDDVDADDCVAGRPYSARADRDAIDASEFIGTAIGGVAVTMLDQHIDDDELVGAE